MNLLLLAMDYVLEESNSFNCEMLLVPLQNINFLAQQGLALRSHEGEMSNFHQLLLLHSLDSPELTKWMAKNTNS